MVAQKMFASFNIGCESSACDFSKNVPIVQTNPVCFNIARKSNASDFSS